MGEVIEQGSEMVEQIAKKGLFSLTLNDIIWLVGVVVLAILAAKVVSKIWKGLLIAAACIIVTVWFVTRFII